MKPSRLGDVPQFVPTGGVCLGPHTLKLGGLGEGLIDAWRGTVDDDKPIAGDENTKAERGGVVPSCLVVSV